MTMQSKLVGVILNTIMIGGLFLAACTSTSTTTPATPAGSSATAVASLTPSKPTGSLKLGLNFHGGAIIGRTGTGLQTGSTFQILVSPIFDSLVEVSPDGQPRPGIAERWEISTDGKTHTFYIRKGVKFHDGTDLKAADVKFSLDENVLAPGVGSGSATSWRNVVSNVEVKDDYNVVLNLKTPQFELLAGLESLEGLGAIIPKKYVQEKGWDYFASHPVGSGPWKVVKFEPNTRMELEAVENHWRVVPKFKNLTLTHLLEEGTKVAMLKTGELDIAEISPESVAQLKAAGLKILGHYGASQWYVAIFYDLDNPQTSPFSHVKVRKALSLSIDRKELADKIYSGYAQPSAVFFAPRTGYFFDQNELKPDPLDTDQAKKLLAEAGYPNGFNTKVWDTGAGGIISTVNLALAGYWRKSGINVELSPRDYPTVLKMFNPKHTPEVWNTMFIVDP
ncbi:MAG: ABC transporter substrate-binding protein [Dehalococcoidia bacterium]|nr:ABC transporter substrate-binding protein [Dehalococcoidia bacterium]